VQEKMRAPLTIPSPCNFIHRPNLGSLLIPATTNRDCGAEGREAVVAGGPISKVCPFVRVVCSSSESSANSNASSAVDCGDDGIGGAVADDGFAQG